MVYFCISIYGPIPEANLDWVTQVEDAVYHLAATTKMSFGSSSPFNAQEGPSHGNNQCDAEGRQIKEYWRRSSRSEEKKEASCNLDVDELQRLQSLANVVTRPPPRLQSLTNVVTRPRSPPPPSNHMDCVCRDCAKIYFQRRKARTVRVAQKYYQKRKREDSIKADAGAAGAISGEEWCSRGAGALVPF